MTAVVERYHFPGPETPLPRRGNVHLHVVEDITLGRLTRTAGECLCSKRRGSDERELDPGDRNTLWRCERCYAIAARNALVLLSDRRTPEAVTSEAVTPRKGTGSCVV